MLIPKSFAKEWVRSEEEFKFLSNKLIYSNRSSCAKKSQLPTKSVFLIVDNMNIAKAAYRLAKIRGMPPLHVTDDAVRVFRMGLTKLISIISNRLLSGDLSLVEDKFLSHEYLKNNWEQSGSMDLNSFTSCRVVKKLSSLYSHLNVTRPDHFLLEEMAKEMVKLEDAIDDCQNPLALHSPEVALYQFDITPVDDDFKKIGFQFWYSLKVYLSWAFRFSDEIQVLTAPYDFLFRSSNLEEMILFFSNGCESITQIQCSDYDLNLERLKDYTVPANLIDFSFVDSLKPIPDLPVNDFFSKPLPNLDDDFLNLSRFETGEEWLQNFRDNYIKGRGYQKIRIRKAFSAINMISLATNPSQIETKVLKEISENTQLQNQEIFYLCSEFGIAYNDLLPKVKNDFDLLRMNSFVKKTFSELYDDELVAELDFLSDLALRINHICKRLEEEGFWVNTDSFEQDGFSPWYLQYVRGEKIIPTEDKLDIYSNLEGDFLKLNGTTIICKTGTHCARIFLNSFISVSSLAKYLQIISPNSINSNNMANPLSSHMVCGAYDPWAKKNKMIYDIFHDLTQAAVFGLFPSPVYVSADLIPKTLTSFSTLIKEGKVFYDPRYDPKKIKLSLIADLGSLIGVPCAVAISGSKLNSFEYYTFNGISLSGCRERSIITTNISTNNDLQHQSGYHQICASCAINLQTISSVVSNINPVLRFSYFLFKGIARLVSHLKDSNDLSKDWSISPLKVALSYRYHGSISKTCGKNLLKGKSCLPKKCERKMVEEFVERYQVSPVSSNFKCFFDRGEIKIKECDQLIYLSQRGKLNIKTDCDLKERK